MKTKEPLRVESLSNPTNLLFVYKFAPETKKYGILKYTESGPYMGGPYSARLESEKGAEIVDKEIWEDVLSAISDFRLKNKDKRL